MKENQLLHLFNSLLDELNSGHGYAGLVKQFSRFFSCDTLLTDDIFQTLAFVTAEDKTLALAVTACGGSDPGGGSSAQSTSTPGSSSVTVEPEESVDAPKLVDIGGGRHLSVHCVGTGSPTILLESGRATSRTSSSGARSSGSSPRRPGSARTTAWAMAPATRRPGAAVPPSCWVAPAGDARRGRRPTPLSAPWAAAS